MVGNVVLLFMSLCLVVPVSAQNAPTPCEDDEVYRQFDFWLGEWEVHAANGNKAGNNKITRHERGCLLREEWTNINGGTGQSINYYDPQEKKWNQVWTDATGNIGYFKGELVDGAMVLKGRWVNQNGSSYLLNGTWSLLEDGRVRQHFQQSQDKGETWTTWFDGYYSKVSD